MGSQNTNPMAEYLLKLQLIIKNSEFKNKEEADKYETLDSKLNGEAYVRAVLKTDLFESYQYDEKDVYNRLLKAGYDEDRIFALMLNPSMIPHDIKEELLNEARSDLISKYKEPNKYYLNLTGVPYPGDDNTPGDTILRIPDEFYDIYGSDPVIQRSEPIHELPEKYQELFMNSKFYEMMLNKYPDATYLRYIGTNSIPLTISRKARDGDIMRINTNKLSTYHAIFGNVTVGADIVHAFSNIYRSTRDYIYQTLRGDFSSIYPNYNSLIRFLTIYMSIGASMNEFQRKSNKLIYMNNVTANNLFMLYGLPSVIMEGTPMIEFLKKFRLLLMDKGTNVVYRVKDLIGYHDTDIYTLVMVKQQVFQDGIPVYHYEKDGTKTPVQNIVFRRMGTAEDNTSYFKFRESKKEYTLDEITSGDPRWWNCTEIDTMLEDMNYTLSNSKYIQLSTHMSMSDIWWQCVIFLRGLLDRHQETSTTLININRDINGSSTISVYDAVLTLIVIMHWQMIDVNGNSIRGDMYIPSEGKYVCLDMLFNGMDGFTPNPLKEGLPFKIASFNFDIIRDNYDAYMALYEYDYLEPEYFMEMVNNVINRTNPNVGEVLMKDIKLIYKYLETKLRESRTIRQFRQATDAFNLLFLVDPIRDWYDHTGIDTDKLLCEKYGISTLELDQFKSFFHVKGYIDAQGNVVKPDFVIEYNGKSYDIYLNEIMNNNVYTYEINGETIFRNKTFVSLFDMEVMKYNNDKTIQSSTLSSKIKENYKRIIIDKVNIDLGSSAYGPTTFENLLMVSNPSLYESILRQKADSDDSIILLLRSIIKALESYSNTNLSALEANALGSDEYFRILKEVISYFKSYMVEFTKEEFTHIFGGLFDNGGNSDMLKLFDEIDHGTIQTSPSESLTLYDVSYADVYHTMSDNMSLYDDALFRFKTAYKNIVDTGYDIWYDNGKRITKMNIDIDDDTEVIVNIVKSGDSYKAIININNIDNNQSTYYGNVK